MKLKDLMDQFDPEVWIGAKGPDGTPYEIGKVLKYQDPNGKIRQIVLQLTQDGVVDLRGVGSSDVPGEY